MTKNKRRLYLVLCAVVGGGVYFGLRRLSGQSPDAAGLQTIIWLAVMALVFLVLFRSRRKSLARMSAQGQVSCFMRRPAAPAEDRYRKWKSILLVPDSGALTIHPTLGGTLITRDSPFTVKVHRTDGSRRPATTWEKFNRLGANCVVLPLETNEGLLEIAAGATTLDTIESSLAGTMPGHSMPKRPEPK